MVEPGEKPEPKVVAPELIHPISMCLICKTKWQSLLNLNSMKLVRQNLHHAQHTYNCIWEMNGTSIVAVIILQATVRLAALEVTHKKAREWNPCTAYSGGMANFCRVFEESTMKNDFCSSCKHGWMPEMRSTWIVCIAWKIEQQGNAETKIG